jgi:hypothetical protein
MKGDPMKAWKRDRWYVLTGWKPYAIATTAATAAVLAAPKVAAVIAAVPKPKGRL